MQVKYVLRFFLLLKREIRKLYEHMCWDEFLDNPQTPKFFIIDFNVREIYWLWVLVTCEQFLRVPRCLPVWIQMVGPYHRYFHLQKTLTTCLAHRRNFTRRPSSDVNLSRIARATCSGSWKSSIPTTVRCFLAIVNSVTFGDIFHGAASPQLSKWVVYLLGEYNFKGTMGKR